MLLKVCWGSLRLIFAALGSILGDIVVLLGPPDGSLAALWLPGDPLVALPVAMPGPPSFRRPAHP